MPDAPSNSAKVLFGWSLFWHFMPYAPSNSAKVLFGWSLFWLFMPDAPSNSAKVLFGWSLYWRFMPDAPSDSAKVLFGWSLFWHSLFEHHRILSKPKMDVRQVPENSYCGNPLHISPDNPHHFPIISLSEQVQMIQQVIQVVEFPPVRISRQQRAHLLI